MGWRGTGLMIAVLGGLGYALYVSGEGPAEDPSPTEPVLGGRHVLDAWRISILRQPTLEEIVLERRDGVYFLVEPIRDLAAPGRVEDLARIYDTARLLPAYEQDAIDDRVLEDTGLAEPKAHIRLEYEDGFEVMLELGAEGPRLQDRFARTGGRIFRVQKALYSALQLNTSELRERFVFRNTYQQATRVRIDRRTDDGGREVVELASPTGGGWTLTKPKTVRLDQARAMALIRSVLSLQAVDFVPGRPREQGPPTPDGLADAIVEIEGMLGPERVVLNSIPEVGALLGHAKSRDRDLWFTCDRTSYDGVLSFPLAELRARWLIGFAIDDVTKIRVDPGAGRGEAFELERSGLQPFRIVQPVRQLANPTAVVELTQGLRSMLAQRFVDDAATDLDRYGLGDGALTVSVWTPRSRKPEVLKLGDDLGAESSYMKRADEAVVVAIPRPVADRIRRPWISYVGLDVVDVDDRSLVRRVIVEAAASPRRFERSEPDGGWRARGDDAPNVDVAIAVEESLSKLAGERVFEARSLDLDALPRVGLELQDGTGRNLHALELFEREDGRLLARPVGSAFVWLLPPREGRELRRLW